jgi:hypothetical protein
MKKFYTAPAIAALVLFSCATAGDGAGGATAAAHHDAGTGLSLHEAVERAAENIAGQLPAGARVAVVAFDAPNDNLSEHIMEELTGALFDRRIEVADRRTLPFIMQELEAM